MKDKSLIVLCFMSMMCGTSLAVNGTYCCSHPNEEIYTNEEGNSCLDPETKSMTKFTLNCFDNMTFLITNNSEFLVKLSPEGKLVLMVDEVTEFVSVSQGDFCLGHQTEDGILNTSVVALCMDDPEPEPVSQEILGWCMATSSVFLALIAFVYLALPELRDLQGKSIISFCGSLAIANAFMCVLKVMEYTDMTWCAIRGFFAYYFIISSFFWMNAIAVQIMLSIKRSSVCNYGWREFMWYALYAWGTPALLTIILVIVNYHPGHHVKPGIGHQHCWFLDLTRMWIYMYSVMSILITINIGIFIYTSVYLWRYTFSSNHVKALKYKFSMMLRLFIMMGLPWIFEMVTSLTSRHIIWVILDLSNCLQGVIIFLILVVFRRRVIKALSKRDMLCCLSGLAERYLAKAGNDEDDIVTHTIAMPMEEK